jgi:hypothetical protein
MRPPSVSLVRWLVFGTIAVSLFHFTDNAVNVDTYPKAGWQPAWFDVVVVIAWFLYTAVGVAAYRLYRQGRFRQAHVGLVLYGFLIASSLGHFFYGSPSELTTRAVISVFVDVAAGSLVIAVAAWSMLARQRASASEPDAAAAGFDSA